VIPGGLGDKIASCTLGMLNGDSTDCHKYPPGHIFPYERGHIEDCVLRDSMCLPEIMTYEKYYEPPPEETTSIKRALRKVDDEKAVRGMFDRTVEKAVAQ